VNTLALVATISWLTSGVLWRYLAVRAPTRNAAWYNVMSVGSSFLAGLYFAQV